MYDAVNLFATAFGELNEQNPITTESLDCSQKQKWIHGLGLLEYIKLVNFNLLKNYETTIFVCIHFSMNTTSQDLTRSFSF